MAASGGVWLKNDGAVYYGDTDLSVLWEQMEGKDEDTWNVLNFPNAGCLSAYHTFFLLKADEQTAESFSGIHFTLYQALYLILHGLHAGFAEMNLLLIFRAEYCVIRADGIYCNHQQEKRWSYGWFYYKHQHPHGFRPVSAG